MDMSNEEKFIIARWAYNVDEPIIDDFEYNNLVEYFKETKPQWSYSRRHWRSDPCPKELLVKFGMEDLVKKVIIVTETESIGAIKSERVLRNTFKDISKPGRLSFKIDGHNHTVNYYNGSFVSGNSRGTSGNMVDREILKLVAPELLEYKGSLSATGELVVKSRRWEEYKKLRGVKSQRNAVATAVANGDVDFLGFLVFRVVTKEGVTRNFSEIEEMGFTTPRSMVVNSYDTLMFAINHLSKQAETGTYPYPTDGLVFEYEDHLTAIRIGHYGEEAMYSYVVGYEETQGMYGLAINVIMHPVEVEGVNRTRIPLTNLGRVVENNLKIGSPVCFVVTSKVSTQLDPAATRHAQETYYDLEAYKKLVESGSI